MGEVTNNFLKIETKNWILRCGLNQQTANQNNSNMFETYKF